MKNCQLSQKLIKQSPKKKIENAIIIYILKFPNVTNFRHSSEFNSSKCNHFPI